MYSLVAFVALGLTCLRFLASLTRKIFLKAYVHVGSFVLSFKQDSLPLEKVDGKNMARLPFVSLFKGGENNSPGKISFDRIS